VKKTTCIIFLLVFSLVACAPAMKATQGEKLFKEAQTFEGKAQYLSADKAYHQAKPLLVKEGNGTLADQCRYAFTRMRNITDTYPYTVDEVKKMIKEKYPETTDGRIEEVIAGGRLPNMTIEGTTYYFQHFMNTLFHLYPDFRVKKEAGALGHQSKLMEVMGPFINDRAALKPGQTLTRPFSYSAAGEAVIPRDKLAKKGLLKIWMPLPLVNAAQQNLRIVSLYPEKYIKYPIKNDGDIGLAYFEVPLEEIKGDLTIGAKFTFIHYEEKFNVDPSNVGMYDKDTDLYRRYTASYKNITITPAIKKMAGKIAGDETNPYLIAKKFYDYIVYDLDYSYTPHETLDALSIPESVFVNQHGYGDCGAQSMYFAALCRSMGIPARAAGGMQLFPNPKTGCGDHFWAQFYLPNYGWVPVDTSVGQLAKYDSDMTDKEKHDFIEYFFSNMDPYRYLIQVDVDVPLIPLPDEPMVFSIVLQEPLAICAEMDENPSYVIIDQWKIIVKRE
jgi:hypothetical protein